MKFGNVFPKVVKHFLGITETFAPQKFVDVTFKLKVTNAFFSSNHRFELTPFSFDILSMVTCDGVHKMTSMSNAAVH